MQGIRIASQLQGKHVVIENVVVCFACAVLGCTKGRHAGCTAPQAAQLDPAGITLVRKSFDARKEKVFK